MFGELFLSSLLIILGISIVLRAFFGINIPIFRAFIGIFLIYFGIQLIENCPTNKKRANQSIYFDKQSFAISPETIKSVKNRRFSIFFGTTNIDLSKVDIIDMDIKPVEIGINTGFGKTKVILNRNLPTEVISNTSFGLTTFPNDTEIYFGSYTYHIQHDKKPELILKTNTAFGMLEVETE